MTYIFDYPLQFELMKDFQGIITNAWTNMQVVISEYLSLNRFLVQIGA